MRSTAPTQPATPDQPVPDGTPRADGSDGADDRSLGAVPRRRRALRGAAALLAAGALVGGTLVAPAVAA
ncbi:hypothetical protein, partial [Cellulomonas biazotea]